MQVACACIYSKSVDCAIYMCTERELYCKHIFSFAGTVLYICLYMVVLFLMWPI